MALKDNSYEHKGMWNKFSTDGKIFFAVSFILSCASVSSFADGIFQFQGFLETVVEFYRVPVDYVIELAGSYWGLAMKRSTVEMFVLNALLAASFSKALSVYFKPGLTRYALIVTYVLFVTILDYQDWSFGDAPRPENLPYYFYAVLFASLFISGFLIPATSDQARQTASIHRFAVVYILTILLFVAAIAIISEDLLFH
jgi:hypothetical protein